MVDLNLNSDLLYNEEKENYIKFEDWSIVNVVINKSFGDYFIELVIFFIKCVIFFLTPLILFVLFVSFGVSFSNISSSIL